MSTGIEWTDETWNPVTGCTKVSPGCDNCYAERITNRFGGKGAFDTIVLHPERLDTPLKRKKPTTWFVNSMSDLFHADVPGSFIADVFSVMALAPKHRFQVLTKRPGRMRHFLSGCDFEKLVRDKAAEGAGTLEAWSHEWPLPNVWLGVSVEDQERADKRIPVLINTPAAVRFLSVEPLLGPVDLGSYLGVEYMESFEGYGHEMFAALSGRVGSDGGLHWVIAGGESGPGARPMHPHWARTIRDQCIAADVPFFFKQWGGRTPKANGRELAGRTWDEMPA